MIEFDRKVVWILREDTQKCGPRQRMANAAILRIYYRPALASVVTYRDYQTPNRERIELNFEPIGK